MSVTVGRVRPRPHPVAPSRRWLLARLPVRTGVRPDDTVTLADLADPRVVERLGADRSTPTHGPAARKQAALSPVHLAFDAAVTVLVGPSATDDAGTVLGADEVGLVLGDDLTPVAYWTCAGGRWRTTAPGVVGAGAAALLRPVLRLAALRGRISRPVLETIALDSLLWNTAPLARAAGPGWADALAAGTGWTSSRPPASVTCRPDRGPLVTLPARRVCCVLSSRTTVESCPTCPVHPARVRPALTAEWLRGVDDADFARLAGRWRGGAGRPVGP